MRRCQMCRMIVFPWNKGDVADCKVSGFKHLHERCIGHINESDWSDMSDYRRWEANNKRPGSIPLTRPVPRRPNRPQPKAHNAT